MLGHGGLFRQENIEKRKFMSVREWVELCNKDEFRAPGVHDVGQRTRRTGGAASAPRTRRAKKKNEAGSAGPDVVTVKAEPMDEVNQLAEAGPSISATVTPPSSTPADNSAEGRTRPQTRRTTSDTPIGEKPRTRARRNQTKEQREANHARDATFVDGFDPSNDWLPPGTKPSDYTVEFCQELERTYWRNLGIGRAAWYGADTQGNRYLFLVLRSFRL